MSTTRNAALSSPPPPGWGTKSLHINISSQSKSDWLAISLMAAKAVTAAAECIPFPYVKEVKKNRDDLKELCENITEIIRIVQDQLSAHGDTAAVRFKGLCEDLECVLQDVLKAVKQLYIKPRGLSGRFKEVLKLGSTADEISGYRTKIQELRLNFLLVAAIDTNMKVDKALSTATPSSMALVYKSDQQHIFVLHGLGGAGKTQIALKFIQESSSRFSEIFVIDTSTLETIDTGLKNIAAMKNSGSTAQDALQWLCSQPNEWLLLFDNADDPKINLHKFFPQCTHGNILITSRNPGLQVHAGSHALVSDMEETDAVELLLKSSAVATTTANKDTATDIVKALCYLPLAIIQAGAFISQSGALGQYLDLYTENRARLLSEQPVQSHDDYAWTVYTTWQISFDRLSKLAATFLQLCSFLHHERISEKIFSRASTYQFPAHHPSKEELKEPLEFLSQFLGPAGTWDSFRFTKVTSEIRAYSLMSYHLEKNMFSIHPLVHIWSQSTLMDKKTYHYQMVAILGMSMATVPNENMQLVSLEILPHLDSLIGGGTNVTPDFRSEYGWIYSWAGRWKEAKQLQLAVLADQRTLVGEDHPHTLLVMDRLAAAHWNGGELKEAEELNVLMLEKNRKILGEDHPDTLHAMASLGSTYHKLGQFREAEQLYIVVLEKRRKILGEDHPDTLSAMADLGSTHHKLGQFREAEQLYIVVLKKRRKILGEDHPDTLLAMANLGSTFHQMGQCKEAEELELVALEKRWKILGEDHPDTLHAMANLGSTYHKLGQFREAEQLYIVILEKKRKILGEDHPDTLLAMASLGSTYHNLGQFKEAAELNVLVLKKRRKILGEDHPDTLLAMAWLASTCHTLGQFKEAEELEVVVLEKWRKILGEDHPDTLSAMANLGSTYRNLGQFKEAQELEVDVLEKRRKILWEDHPDTLTAMHNLAATYYCQDLFSQAEQLYVELLDKQKNILGDDHPDTVNTANYVAETQQAMANAIGNSVP
ncbi:hypothetical protein FB451DRAFT_1372188 [Mycena latifolia]|nr:hypothetical protein FB451DRAFT_1372188 [Mycena latifolia]